SSWHCLTYVTKFACLHCAPEVDQKTLKALQGSRLFRAYLVAIAASAVACATTRPAALQAEPSPVAPAPSVDAPAVDVPVMDAPPVLGIADIAPGGSLLPRSLQSSFHASRGLLGLKIDLLSSVAGALMLPFAPEVVEDITHWQRNMD